MIRSELARADLALALLFFVVASIVGSAYVRGFVRGGGRQMFYQSYFEPAVHWTCGRGFVRSIAGPQGAVGAFLRTERDSITCADVNPGPVTTEGLYQRAWLYLMLSVGVTWWLLGMSWSGLAPLFGVLFGLTVTTAYALFRLAMGRMVAAGAAVALMVSTLHLTNLPHLRDYAKAPFVLMLVLIALLFAIRPLSTRAAIALAAAYGAILGVGYGFRSDLLANVPPFMLALAFMPDDWRKKRWRAPAALATTAAVFFLVAAPINQQVARTGSCLGHVTLLGFSAPFTDALHVKPAAYDLGIVFNDEVLDAVVTGYANRRAPGTGALEYCAPEYDQVTAAYLSDIARVFPADLLVRAYGSTRQILDIAFEWIDPPARLGIVHVAFRARALVLKLLDGLGVWLAAAALLAISTVNLRVAVFALLMLLYFGGYPAAQFAPRHYFHLEFIGWLIIGFLVHHLVHAVRTRRFAFSVRAAVTFAAMAMAIILVPLWISRAYQHTAVRDVLQRDLSSDGDAIAVAQANDGWSWSIPTLDDRGRVLKLELAADHPCDVRGTLVVDYQTALTSLPWTRPVEVAASELPATLLVPLERMARSVQVTGLGCARVQRAFLVRPAMPLLVHATLPTGWQDGAATLHQSLR